MIDFWELFEITFFFLIMQRWTVNKQMKFEGGFQGRTNKLVDGCYSFWCGAIVPIVQAIISKKGMYFNLSSD